MIVNKLGSYILLASLSQKCKFSPAALQVVVGEIVSAFHLVRPDQLVQTLVAVCGPQDILEKLPSEVVKGILGIPYVFNVLHNPESWMNLFPGVYRKLYSLQLPGWVARTSFIPLFVALFQSNIWSCYFI